MIEELKKVLHEHKEEYLGYLKDIIKIDTQDIGHGILGGKELEGQKYLRTFEKYGPKEEERSQRRNYTAWNREV